MTGGLVQDIQHSVLPNVTPLATISLTLGEIINQISLKIQSLL